MMRCRYCERDIVQGCADDCPRRESAMSEPDPAELVTLGDLLNVAAWLRAAYLRRRAQDWPPFVDAMRSPVLSRLVLQEAQHPTVGATIKRPEVVRPDPPPADVSSPVTQPRSITVTKSENRGGSPTPHPLDFKSLAAGERPELEGD